MEKLIRPMLATLVIKAFNRCGWANEEKYDGFRTLLTQMGESQAPFLRNLKEIAEAIFRLTARLLI